MPHSICSIPECDKKAHSRGWCSGHYRRWHLTGNPIIRCQGCDSALPLQYGAQKYCSPECRPRCEVADCDRPQRKMKWCEKHHARWGRTGDPVKVTSTEWATHWECIVCGKAVEKGSGRRRFCSGRCQGADSRKRNPPPRIVLIPEGQVPVEKQCTIDGCIKQRRYKLYCCQHYSMWTRHGNPLAKPKRNKSGTGSCDNCGEAVSGKKRFCSSQCKWQYGKYEGRRPTETPCAQCGETINLAELVGRAKRLRDVNTKVCGKCRRWTPQRVDRAALLERDFLICGICDEPVDPDLKYPDRMSPSVDHVIPRSLGGSDDFDNLQLAHLACNVMKRDRVDFKIA